MVARAPLVREPLAIPLREARAPLVLAIDVGTSGLRAFVFDAKARPIGSAVAWSRKAARTSRLGEASLDADERARATFDCVDTVLRVIGRRAGEIAAVSVSTFWHSLVGVDARGRPTTRVITWADTRARDAALSLRQELDESEVHARTGCMLHASYLPAKLRWLAAAAPETVARTAHWMSFGEYLYYRAFGERRAAHGMASATGLYAQRGAGWDRPMLAHLGLDERALSPVSDEPLEGLARAFARRWPALAQVPWIPAVGDGACSNVGAGAVRPDTAALMVGTSGALRVVRETADAPVVRGGWTYRLDARRVVCGGALSNGGNALAWIARAFPGVDLEATLRRPVGAHGLVALPLLAGDRSPSWDDAARASIAGIGLGSAPEDVVQAFVEGIVCRFARLWRVVDAALPGIERVVATGGDALSRPYLVQLLADALGRPLVASAAGEGSARGAAIVALERIGAIGDLGSIRSPLGRVFRPRARAHAAFGEAVERQARLEDALRPIGGVAS
ncbi:MAG TPA: gluconokinase [Candidatus Limnocylindria bacterium]|nr:gluconokinase [Candidatus Limnocylindria bacterium]